MCKCVCPVHICNKSMCICMCACQYVSQCVSALLSEFMYIYIYVCVCACVCVLSSKDSPLRCTTTPQRSQTRRTVEAVIETRPTPRRTLYHTAQPSSEPRQLCNHKALSSSFLLLTFLPYRILERSVNSKTFTLCEWQLLILSSEYSAPCVGACIYVFQNE